jgi:hypothetical protein
MGSSKRTNFISLAHWSTSIASVDILHSCRRSGACRRKDISIGTDSDNRTPCLRTGPEWHTYFLRASVQALCGTRTFSVPPYRPCVAHVLSPCLRTGPAWHTYFLRASVQALRGTRTLSAPSYRRYVAYVLSPFPRTDTTLLRTLPVPRTDTTSRTLSVPPYRPWMASLRAFLYALYSTRTHSVPSYRHYVAHVLFFVSSHGPCVAHVLFSVFANWGLWRRTSLRSIHVMSENNLGKLH